MPEDIYSSYTGTSPIFKSYLILTKKYMRVEILLFHLNYNNWKLSKVCSVYRILVQWGKSKKHITILCRPKQLVQG